MFVQGQDSVDKELTRRFPAEEFSWINDNFPNEEEDEEEGEEQTKDNLINWISADNVIDVKNTNVIET